MLPYRIHPLAERELDEAIAHYEALAPLKGLELSRRVKAAIDQVRQFPESAPVTRGKVRSIIVKPVSRWHYTVHYEVLPNVILILAVAHQAREPFYWLRRSVRR